MAVTKFKLVMFFLLINSFAFAEEQGSEIYKKKVLDEIELKFLMSHYTQDGDNSAVMGGHGSEKLEDTESKVIVNIPLNEDDVLTVMCSMSAYTSASSSNINPFDAQYVTPWVASSGASAADELHTVNVNYSHSSDTRDNIVGVNIGLSSEFDYSSFGFGGDYLYLFNNKNSEIGFKGQIYLDNWKIFYPRELLNNYFFDEGTIVDSDGNQTNEYNSNLFTPLSDKKRNTISLSFTYSQIWNKRFKTSIIIDYIRQEGVLSTPYQRIYFSDINDYFIDEFQLADNIEQLPNSRIKIPIGIRGNYYLNDLVILRGYYRFYNDNWGITAHTINFEIPIKATSAFVVYPFYRYYNQTKSNYFYEYNRAISADIYYTSDYDLSDYNTYFYGFGFNYTRAFRENYIKNKSLKNIFFRYGEYVRSTGLESKIISLEFVFSL